AQPKGADKANKINGLQPLRDAIWTDPSEIKPFFAAVSAAREKESPVCVPLSSARYRRTRIAKRNILVGVAQIFMRIYRNLMHAHLIVQVGTRGAARLADIADNLAANHMLPRDYRNRGKMPVDSGNVVPVVDNDFPAIAADRCRRGHVAVSRGTHRRTVRRVDVDTGMKSALSIKRILPRAEAGADPAFQRP